MAFTMYHNSADFFFVFMCFRIQLRNYGHVCKICYIMKY